MNILITGGAGFIGSNLIEQIINRGHGAISLDNYSTGYESNHISGAEYLKFNITNSINLVNKNIDCIVHCAAKARIQKSFSDDKEYFNTNIIGTYNIVKFASQNHIPLIYIGTSSEHSGKFSNPYTFTKHIGENIIELYKNHFGLIATVARLYNVYGQRECTNENGTLIGKWKYNYIHNLPFIVYGDGSKRRDFTHVRDICNALLSIIENKKYGYLFELGRGEDYSLKEIIDMFNYKNIIYKDDLPGEAEQTCANNVLAKEILNWNPTYSIFDYIKMIKYKKIQANA